MVTVDSVGLTYDALDRMVEQNSGGSYTQLVYGPNGNKLALMNGQTLFRGRVPLPGGVLAIYWSNPLTLVRYWHPNWQGSGPAITSANQTMLGDEAYAPYGEQYAENGGAADFTGQWAATEPDLYDFLYREYHPTQGRWLTPDPAGLAAVDPSNPQSWNRYAYVTNNPLALIDPLGLQPPGCPQGMPTNECYGGIPGFWAGGIAPGMIEGGAMNEFDWLEAGVLPGGSTGGCSDPAVADVDPECEWPPLQGGGVWGGGGSGNSIPGFPSGPWGNADQPADIVCTVVNGELSCTIRTTVYPPAGNLPTVITGGLLGAIIALLPNGYYWNPIDQATNPYHSGQWSFRQILGSVCSTHVIVSKGTGQVTSHVDTVNPVPGWALLVPTLAPTIWMVHFAGHAALDMGGLFPSSEACM